MPMADEPLAAAAGSVTLGGDLTVRRMALGARWITQAGPEGARALLRRALDLGINLIDTADIYGGWESERFIAEALHPYPEGLVIATKGGQIVVEGKAAPDCRPEYLRAACEESLGRLRLERIDHYQLHNPDPKVPIEESVGTLAELRAEGKIRHIGVSNLHAELWARAQATTSIVSLQNLHSVLHRPGEPELEECERRGIVFFPYRPLGEGELVEANGTLGEIATAHGATVAQVALAWLLQRSPVMVVIPGTASIAHLEENTRAAELRLSPEELEQLSS
jgi:pyridoxine 4-dehydrogenase